MKKSIIIAFLVNFVLTACQGETPVSGDPTTTPTSAVALFQTLKPTKSPAETPAEVVLNTPTAIPTVRLTAVATVKPTDWMTPKPMQTKQAAPTATPTALAKKTPAKTPLKTPVKTLPPGFDASFSPAPKNPEKLDAETEKCIIELFLQMYDNYNGYVYWEEKFYNESYTYIKKYCGTYNGYIVVAVACDAFLWNGVTSIYDVEVDGITLSISNAGGLYIYGYETGIPLLIPIENAYRQKRISDEDVKSIAWYCYAEN